MSFDAMRECPPFWCKVGIFYSTEQTGSDNEEEGRRRRGSSILGRKFWLETSLSLKSIFPN